MIISASRRTDIPAFYSDWLMHRLTAGSVLVPNPRSVTRWGQVSLALSVVDCLVFWTKNPIPMLDKLARIEEMGYAFYFQFTLTPYGRDIEPHLPPKDELIAAFRALAKQLGKHRVQWRYDPVLLDEAHTIDWHAQQFDRLCAELADSTTRCTISFIDQYRSMKKAFRPLTQEEMTELAATFAATARGYHLPVCTCAEAVDLSHLGISHGACIDKSVVEAATGCAVALPPAKNQRDACACVDSVDIGVYDTCGNGCRYCYATWSLPRAVRQLGAHDPHAPALIGYPPPDAIITQRAASSGKYTQQSLFGAEKRT